MQRIFIFFFFNHIDHFSSKRCLTTLSWVLISCIKPNENARGKINMTNNGYLNHHQTKSILNFFLMIITFPFTIELLKNSLNLIWFISIYILFYFTDNHISFYFILMIIKFYWSFKIKSWTILSGIYYLAIYLIW